MVAMKEWLVLSAIIAFAVGFVRGIALYSIKGRRRGCRGCSGFPAGW